MTAQHLSRPTHPRYTPLRPTMARISKSRHYPRPLSLRPTVAIPRPSPNPSPSPKYTQSCYNLHPPLPAALGPLLTRPFSPTPLHNAPLASPLTRDPRRARRAGHLPPLGAPSTLHTRRSAPAPLVIGSGVGRCRSALAVATRTVGGAHHRCCARFAVRGCALRRRPLRGVCT
jgi:hypothetical protein